MFRFAALTTAAFLVSSVPASAMIMQATYTGVVGQGSYDWTGIFGHGTGDNVLDNLPFTAIFIYDTAGATVTPTSSSVVGGAGVTGQPPNPMISATLTINNHSFVINQDYQGNIAQENSTSGSTAYHADKFRYVGPNELLGYYIGLGASIDSWAIPATLDVPYSIDFSGDHPDFVDPSFSFIERHAAEPDDPLLYTMITTGDLISAHLTVSEFDDSPSPVPLPGALPLLASGFGVLGLMRLQRRKA